MNGYSRDERIREISVSTVMSLDEATAYVDAELAAAEASRRGAELDDTRFRLVPNRADRRRAERRRKGRAL